MKKLMIAAAAAAICGGAFAAGSLCEDDPTAPAAETQCALYNVKFTFKTLDAKLLKVKGYTIDGGECGDDEDVEAVKYVYLENGSRTLEGIIWDCDAACDTLNDVEMNFILWEKKGENVFTAKLAYESESNKTWVAGTSAFDFINRYSKKATKVQAYWTLDDLDGVSIVAAGFGTFDNKKALVKSISGNAVGTFDAPLTTKYTECGEPLVVDLCTEFESYEDGEGVVKIAASGKWTVKYNSSLSKGKKRLSQIVPGFAQDK